jgi:hypothetical protein
MSSSEEQILRVLFEGLQKQDFQCSSGYVLAEGPTWDKCSVLRRCSFCVQLLRDERVRTLARQLRHDNAPCDVVKRNLATGRKKVSPSPATDLENSSDQRYR